MTKQKKLKDIHKDIRNITLEQKKNGLPFDIRQEKYSVNLAKKLKKKIDSEDWGNVLDLAMGIAVLVYDYYKKHDCYQEMKKISHDYSRKEESKKKDEVLGKSLKDNYDVLTNIDWGDHKKAEEIVLDRAKIFFLASSHNDSAEDHRDYQGKIYIDERWKSLIKDTEIKKRIEEYVINNKVKTFQWVTGKPVWFITRPNCRHYFQELSANEVLSNSVSTLIRDYRMHSKIGQKEQKTIAHRIDKGWYTKENITNIINQYKERLAYHQSLYDAQKTEDLKQAIAKDKLLIEKWEGYLQKNFK